MPPRCYVASPLGFSEATRGWYAERLLPALAAHVEPVDPWTLGDPEGFAAAARDGREREHALEVGARNAEAIRSCALLVAHLDGQEPDSGTVAELGFAAGLGLRCYGVRSDLRQAGEPGVALNLQVESFVVGSGGAVLPGLDALLRRLAADLGDGAAGPGAPPEGA